MFFISHCLCFPEQCFPLHTWTSLTLSPVRTALCIKRPQLPFPFSATLTLKAFLWRLDLWLWKVPSCAVAKAQGFWFSVKTKIIAEEFLDEFYREPLINIWKKKKKESRDVLPVFINHAVFYCFFVTLQQKAVTKLVACIEGCPESEQNEKTAKELFHGIFASFSPKIIPVLKRMQHSSCLAWKWEAPVFEWGIAARSTWCSHNNGKTTVWWSDGEAKEMDLSGGHSLTLGFFLHLRKKNLNAFSCPVVSILI